MIDYSAARAAMVARQIAARGIKDARLLDAMRSVVMPVGATRFMQHLVKLTRLGEDEYAEQNLGAVRFVPLIGVHGFSETAGRSG